jgi:hypothetical protein
MVSCANCSTRIFYCVFTVRPVACHTVSKNFIKDSPSWKQGSKFWPHGFTPPEIVFLITTIKSQLLAIQQMTSSRGWNGKQKDKKSPSLK